MAKYVRNNYGGITLYDSNGNLLTEWEPNGRVAKGSYDNPLPDEVLNSDAKGVIHELSDYGLWFGEFHYGFNVPENFNANELYVAPAPTVPVITSILSKPYDSSGINPGGVFTGKPYDPSDGTVMQPMNPVETMTPKPTTTGATGNAVLTQVQQNDGIPTWAIIAAAVGVYLLVK